MGIDAYIFNSLHQYAGKYRVLDTIAVWVAEYVGYIMLVLIGVMALATGRWQMFFWPLIAGLIARFVFNEAIYAFYQRKRPSDFFGFEPLIKKPHHPAFPSGHAAFFLGMACTLLAYSIPLGVVAIVVSLLIGLARVFCGVHWPVDIMAGLIMGIVASIIVVTFL